MVEGNTQDDSLRPVSYGTSAESHYPVTTGSQHLLSHSSNPQDRSLMWTISLFSTLSKALCKNPIQTFLAWTATPWPLETPAEEF